MRCAAIVVASLVALFAASDPAAAETPSNKPPAAKSAPAAPQPAQAPPPAAARPPPYEAQLLRLAEMMGALTYLRDLCGLGDGAKFRAKLEALLKAEGITEQRRDFIAGAYNQAFRGYATTYRECTPAASEIIARFLTESARLAEEVASKYGG